MSRHRFEGALCAHGARLVVAVVTLAFGQGCGGDAVSLPAPSASTGVSSAPSVSPPKTRGLKRTPPTMALSNFQGQIREYESLYEHAPQNVEARSRLANALVSRGQLLGKPSDLVRALKLAEQAEPTAAPTKELLRFRASVFAAVHQFDRALQALEAAVPSDDLRQPTTAALARAAIWAAQGELDQALPTIQLVRAARDEIGVLTLEAKVLGELGRVDDAVATFAKAEAKYRNPAPFALADLHVERGLMWETRGELGKAKESYRAAVDLLPMHAHAVLHLAQLVPPKEGLELLGGLARTTDDPEVAGRVGELKELLEKGSGEADLKTAATGYDAIVKELPEAYADHAGWFYAGPGNDPDKAWKWASKNLEIRKTSGAYALSLTAARLARRPEAEHCELAKRAKAYAWPSPRLTEELSAFARTAQGAACGP